MAQPARAATAVLARRAAAKAQAVHLTIYSTAWASAMLGMSSLKEQPYQ